MKVVDNPDSNTNSIIQQNKSKEKVEACNKIYEL